MGDSSKQICRLCLEITPSCESEPIEGIKKDIVEVLLINIDFDISDYAVTCNRCFEKLQDCFRFKSHCLNASMNVDFKIDIKKEVLQSDLTRYGSICQEGHRECWLCMSAEIEAFNCTADWKDGVLLKDMIRRCFPEMDSNAVHEPIICRLCQSSINKYYEFMKNCEQVEQRIKHFRQVAGHGIADKVILADMLKDEDYDVFKPVIIKDEYSESVNESLTKCLESEKIASIKCEEIDIKVDSDDELKMNDHNELEDCDNSGYNGFSKTERKVGKSVSTGKNHFCPKCPYSSKKRDHFRDHMRTHSNDEVHECFLCPFITDTKFSLKAHMTSHRGPTKAYGCLECPYETDYRSSYRRHLLKHRDKPDVETHKCPLCSYKTKCRASVGTHLKMHHNINNRKMCECKKSSYSTKHKVNRVSHQSVHTNPKRVEKYKCDKCEFETKYKQSLVRHMIMHEDPETANKFKCDKCPYRGKRQRDIKDHMIVHSDKRPFSCTQCSYSGKNKKQLRAHKVVHQKDGERRIYKCNLCRFQAKKDITLKAHMAKSHRDTSVPIIKCAHCSYETAIKFYLLKHMRKWHRSKDTVHMVLKETVVLPATTKI